jgi:hypothetical protein
MKFSERIRSEFGIMIVPDASSRKKRYRFRGGLIEKFPVIANAARCRDMDEGGTDREREREGERGRGEVRESCCGSFYTPVNILVTECFLDADGADR